MNSPLLSHALVDEFPALSDRIHLLKQNDAHFAKLLAEHDAVDAQITRDEEKIEPLNDTTLHSLKQHRAHLKDQLYHMLTSH